MLRLSSAEGLGRKGGAQFLGAPVSCSPTIFQYRDGHRNLLCLQGRRNLIQLPANLGLRHPPPAHHYPSALCDVGHVLQWITLDQNQVGAFTDLDSSEVVLALKIVDDILCARLNDLIRGESALHHERHLAMDREARNTELLRRVRAQ
jgi:hypothetical protein